MLQLAPTLAFVIMACLGAGRIFLFEASKAAGKEDRPGDSLLRAGFSGLCGLGLLALVGGLANLFLPLSTISVWVMSAAAIGALFRVKRVWPVERTLDAAILFILALAFSSRAVLHGDTGNYHHQAVLWMAQETLPFGLANLHGRFGFNSSWWVVGAWMEFPWHPAGASIYLPTGVLCFFFGLIVLGSIKNLGADWPAILILGAGYLWFRQLTGINNPSFSTDAPANLFIVASAAALLRPVTDDRDRVVWVAVWGLLGASAATFKLTALPWFGLSFLAAVWYTVRAGFLPAGKLAFCLAPGCLAVAIYAIRGVMISGYPFYPTRLLGFWNIPWRVPDAGIAGDTEGIRNWPTRGEGGGFFEFARRWIDNQFGMTNIVFAAVLALALALLLIFVARRGGLARLRAGYAPILPIGLAAGVGLAVCFAYAPALRFVSGYFFVLAGLVAAGAFHAGQWLGATAIRSLVVGGAIVAAVLPNVGGAVSLPVSWVRLPPLPSPVVTEKVTDQGEVIRVNIDGQSWAAQPPSTPHFHPGLTIQRDERNRVVGFLPPPR